MIARPAAQDYSPSIDTRVRCVDKFRTIGGLPNASRPFLHPVDNYEDVA
jgi:hypothetical protein